MNDGQVQDVVGAVVNDYTTGLEVFSAFDITKEVRTREGGHVATHDRIKSFVHQAFRGMEMPTSYRQTLITLATTAGDFQAFVYHPDCASAYDHPLAKKQTVQVTIPDGLDDSGDTVPAPDFGSDDGDVDDSEPSPSTDSVVVEVTVSEQRINIPKKILNKVPVPSTGKYRFNGDGGKTIFRSPNEDGRIRIAASFLGSKSKYSVTVDSDNRSINISPA